MRDGVAKRCSEGSGVTIKVRSFFLETIYRTFLKQIAGQSAVMAVAGGTPRELARDDESPKEKLETTGRKSSVDILSQEEPPFGSGYYQLNRQAPSGYKPEAKAIG